MRVAYADPPYPGQAKRHYADHPDYAGEVDHAQLARDLMEYDGWALSTSAPALYEVQHTIWKATGRTPAEDYRVMAWVKPFAAYKRNVKVAYTWEPVLVAAARNPEPNQVEGIVCRDHIAEPITMKRGLTGAKPEKFCWWLFEVLGMDPDDELVDLFPGSGAVTAAHATWKNQRAQMTLEAA